MTFTQIPPATVLGPIESKLSDLQARVAENLHVDASDPWLISSVDAAILYVIDYTNRNTIGLPDDSTTMNSLVGFASAIYQSSFSPTGVQIAVADSAFEPVFPQQRVLTYWRREFHRLDRAWGIA